MPPAALMRATSMSNVFFSGAPSAAYVPVSETTAPILYGAFSPRCLRHRDVRRRAASYTAATATTSAHATIAATHR